MSEPIYEEGKTVRIYADIFPANVSPIPPGVPATQKLRAIITEKALTVGWLAGQDASGPIVNRVDIISTAVNANYLGGTVENYAVKRGQGCSCGSTGLRRWNPFPKNLFVSA